MYPPCRSAWVLRPCSHSTRTHKRQTCSKRPRTSLPAAAPPRSVHPSALSRDGRLSVPVGGGHLNAPQACNPTPSPVLPPVSSRRPRHRIHALPRAPLARPAPTAVAHSLLPPLSVCQPPRPRTGRLHNRHRPRPTSHCPGRRQQSQPKVPNLITSTGQLGERNYPHSNTDGAPRQQHRGWRLVTGVAPAAGARLKSRVGDGGGGAASGWNSRQGPRQRQLRGRRPEAGSAGCFGGGRRRRGRCAAAGSAVGVEGRGRG